MDLPARLTEEDFDIAIAHDGTWLHQGAPMTRMPLVRLFAGVLQRDAAGAYWLVTPAERGRITVDDAPFIATLWRIENEGMAAQTVYLTDNLGREKPVDPAHPLALRVPRGRLAAGPGGGVAVPYHQLDGGIEARLATSVYYDLVECALRPGAGFEKDGVMYLLSGGTAHPLGGAA